MTIGESIPVFGSWFQIYFIENNGMAFGMQFGGTFGKLFLTLFRIVLIGAIIYYINKLIRTSAPSGVLVGVSLILVGCNRKRDRQHFYGLIFNESTYNSVATLFPHGGGYSSLFHGKVVDMLYFPLIDTTLPEWGPIQRRRTIHLLQTNL